MEITVTKVKKVEETSKYEIPEESYKKDCLEIYQIKVIGNEVRIKSIYFASYGNSFEVKNIKVEKLDELLQLKDATSAEWLKAVEVAIVL